MEKRSLLSCEECGGEIGYSPLHGIPEEEPFVAYCKKCDVRIRAMTELKDPKKWPAIEAELSRSIGKAAGDDG